MNLEYLTDASGSPRAVVVPMADWESMVEKIRFYEGASQQNDETAYLLSSETMKNRLLEAKQRLSEPAKSWGEVTERFLVPAH